MKSMKSLISFLQGLLYSVLVGLACYLILYGLRTTSFLNGVPFIGYFIQAASQWQIFMISAFAAIFYYASNYLSRTIVIICAAVFLFMIVFWTRDKLPQMWGVLSDFWNSIVNLYQN